MNRWNFLLLLLLMLSLANCTRNEEPVAVDNSLKEVKNESVITALETIAKDSITEDEIENPEIKKEVEKLKSERIEKIKDKVQQSPYKGFSDQEIKMELQKFLEDYERSCDTAIYNKISNLMAFDAVLALFKEQEPQFSRSYFRDLQQAQRGCISK